MRIDFLEYAAMDLPRKEPFTIARGSSTVAQNVMVVVHSGSLSGNGSGAPTDVTGETVRSAMDAIKTMARALEGFTFERPREVADKMDKVLPGNPSVKAAIDIAVHDLAAQHAGVPLHRYLGATRDRMVTDMTIGIMDTRSAVERAQRWTQAGFRALKVKIGRDPKADMDRLPASRGAGDRRRARLRPRPEERSVARLGFALQSRRGSVDRLEVRKRGAHRPRPTRARHCVVVTHPMARPVLPHSGRGPVPLPQSREPPRPPHRRRRDAGA